MASLPNVLLGFVALTTVTWAMDPYDAGLYEDMLFQDLYKRLSQLEDSYYPVADETFGGPAPQSVWEDRIPLDSRDSGQTDIRDPEFLSHSSLNHGGFQYISGGAGEGKQHLTPEGTQENTQEVKSDDVLPFYCHPPNPCPKGFTEEDGCQEGVEDTAEVQKSWIATMERKGMCSCDTEHMFDCPKDGAAQEQEAEDEMLDKMIDTLLGDKEPENNPFAGGNKRSNIVVKKAPRVKRSVSYMDQMKHAKNNPYLQGAKIHTVAKKGHQFQHHE